MAMQAGGWTISWQGTDVTHDDFPNGQTIWEGLKQAAAPAGGSAILSADGSFTDKTDVAIVVLGAEPDAELQGDVPTLDSPPPDGTDLAHIKELHAAGQPAVTRVRL